MPESRVWPLAVSARRFSATRQPGHKPDLVAGRDVRIYRSGVRLTRAFENRPAAGHQVASYYGSARSQRKLLVRPIYTGRERLIHERTHLFIFPYSFLKRLGERIRSSLHARMAARRRDRELRRTGCQSRPLIELTLMIDACALPSGSTPNMLADPRLAVLKINREPSRRPYRSIVIDTSFVSNHGSCGPSRDTEKIWDVPAPGTDSVNAIRFPSGDQLGLLASRLSDVSLLELLPSGSTRNKSDVQQPSMREYAIRDPSGDQAGSCSAAESAVSLWRLVPSDLIRKICGTEGSPSAPANAIQCPSGTKQGCYCSKARSRCRRLLPGLAATRR